MANVRYTYDEMVQLIITEKKKFDIKLMQGGAIWENCTATSAGNALLFEHNGQSYHWRWHNLTVIKIHD